MVGDVTHRKEVVASSLTGNVGLVELPRSPPGKGGQVSMILGLDGERLIHRYGEVVGHMTDVMVATAFEKMTKQILDSEWKKPWILLRLNNKVYIAGGSTLASKVSYPVKRMSHITQGGAWELISST